MENGLYNKPHMKILHLIYHNEKILNPFDTTHLLIEEPAKRKLVLSINETVFQRNNCQYMGKISFILLKKLFEAGKSNIA